jgi:predicted nucleic acid-binding Zn finger protein
MKKNHTAREFAGEDFEDELIVTTHSGKKIRVTTNLPYDSKVTVDFCSCDEKAFWVNKGGELICDVCGSVIESSEVNRIAKFMIYKDLIFQNDRK